MKMHIDIDVCDDVCEELYIAFCGPMELTESGEKQFGEALDYELEITGDVAIVKIDDDNDDVWGARLEKAKELFYSLAGYCSSDDYDKWFKEV